MIGQGWYVVRVWKAFCAEAFSSSYLPPHHHMKCTHTNLTLKSLGFVSRCLNVCLVSGSGQAPLKAKPNIKEEGRNVCIFIRSQKKKPINNIPG